MRKVEKTITFNSWDDISDFTTNLKPNIEVHNSKAIITKKDLSFKVDKLIIHLPEIEVNIPTSGMVNLIAQYLTLQYPLSFEISKTMNSNEIYSQWEELVETLFISYRDNMDEAKSIIIKGIQKNPKTLQILESQALLNTVEKMI